MIETRRYFWWLPFLGEYELLQNKLGIKFWLFSRATTKSGTSAVVDFSLWFVVSFLSYERKNYVLNKDIILKFKTYIYWIHTSIKTELLKKSLFVGMTPFWNNKSLLHESQNIVWLGRCFKNSAKINSLILFNKMNE